jgi:hypothetical protein
MQEKSRRSLGLYSISLAGKRGQKVYYDLKKDDRLRLRLRLRQTEPVVAVLVGGRAG